MNIAYVMSEPRGLTDRVLTEAASRLEQAGLRLAGLVQVNTDCGPDKPCDMDVHVLPDGPVLRISQSLGRGARGCRLDPGALETAVAEIGRAMQDPADLLILNKFGKHEAEGNGLRATIAEAVGRGIPVVTGVNARNHDAFVDFVAGAATRIPADPDAIVEWVMRQTGGAALSTSAG
ncbi:MAG: DUF2478 domain-containing protein [Paracoccaceae bacterium]